MHFHTLPSALALKLVVHINVQCSYHRRLKLTYPIIVAASLCGNLVASYPGHPMFFYIHEKNREGLVDFGDVMDVVCDNAH